MICKICGSSNITTIYNGIIRDGALGRYTKMDVPIYQCADCNVIWHENEFRSLEKYYESEDYREELEGGSEEEKFYQLHDKETWDKLTYTGTDIFRHKIVADIGCGCGAFLDFLSGVAQEIIAIEPSETYRKAMEKKRYAVYPYAKDASEDYSGKVDVITSFDVIEHVENPKEFIKEVYDLLAPGGAAIVGTPTDAPVMRKLLGEVYERKLLFSTQHLWIFSEENLKMIAKEQGFCNPTVKFFQRYGIGNMLGWLRDKKPGTGVKDEIISQTLDGVWKGQCADRGLADYIVLYLHK